MMASWMCINVKIQKCVCVEGCAVESVIELRKDMTAYLNR